MSTHKTLSSSLPAGRAPTVLRRAHHGDLIALATLADAAAGRFTSPRTGLARLTALGSGPLRIDPRMIDDGTLWVADCRGRILASAGWTRSAADAEHQRLASHADGQPFAFLRCVLVDPLSSGLGWSRRMVERVEREAQADGVRRCLVLAGAEAAPMYARMGYRALYDFHLHGEGLSLPGLAMSRDFDAATALREAA